MDCRQNCLIDSGFSRFTLCNISLSSITADLVAVGPCGVTFLFSALDSWEWAAVVFPFFSPSPFVYSIFSHFRGRFSLHIRSSLWAKPSPKKPPKKRVNALIKNGMISRRIERENVFWLASLFVCLRCLLFSPVHALETICTEHNFSRAQNIRTVILHVN